MSLITIVPFVLGCLLIVFGCLTWRSIGKRIVLVGIAFASYPAGVALGNNVVLLSVAWASLVALIATNIRTTRRETWRAVRVEVLLAAATIIAMVASYLLTSVSRPIQNALPALVAITAIAFIGSVVLHGIPQLIRQTRHKLS